MQGKPNEAYGHWVKSELRSKAFNVNQRQNVLLSFICRSVTSFLSRFSLLDHTSEFKLICFFQPFNHQVIRVINYG